MSEVSPLLPQALAHPTSRRGFIQKTALTTLMAGVAAACKTNAPSNDVKQAGAATGGTMGPHDTSSGAAAAASAADAMDAMHEAGIKAFPAKTAGVGNHLLEPKLDGGVKVFEVTAQKIQWEVIPGRLVEAWSYNGQIPGPQIRVKEGDRVRFLLKNELPESTAVHFHGLELPNAVDGVPYITQPPVKPGASYTYEFTVPAGNSGSHMYHSHHNSAKQVGLG